jgi:hypothetical protein
MVVVQVFRHAVYFVAVRGVVQRTKVEERNGYFILLIAVIQMITDFDLLFRKAYLFERMAQVSNSHTDLSPSGRLTMHAPDCPIVAIFHLRCVPNFEGGLHRGPRRAAGDAGRWAALLNDCGMIKYSGRK